MMLSSISLTLIGVIFTLVNAGDFPPADPNVKLLLAAWRHGHRNPQALPPINNDPTTVNTSIWEQEGLEQLSKVGKQQTHHLGVVLRQRYGNLIPGPYDPKKVVSHVSPIDRCQMTNQLVHSGLFPPAGYGNWNDSIPWQPISYIADGPMLGPQTTKCKNLLKIMGPAIKETLPGAIEWKNDNKDLIKFVTGKFGFPNTIGGIYYAYDVLIDLYVRKLPLPVWITSENQWKRNIFPDLLQFGEATYTLSSSYTDGQKLWSGLYLADVIKQLNAAKNNSQSAVAYLYSGHSNTPTSTMFAMGIRNHNVFFNGALLIEYRDVPEQSVRVILTEPTLDDPLKRNTTLLLLPGCNKQEWCPLDTFITLMTPHTVDDFDKFCGDDVCFCTPPKPSPEQGGFSPTAMGAPAAAKP